MTVVNTHQDSPPLPGAGAWEPEILAFCCNYCAYAAADLAGSKRTQYPPNIRIVHSPCTGKVEMEHILEAFEKGVDGILIAGCLEGGCHFQEGNLRARKRTERLRQLPYVKWPRAQSPKPLADPAQPSPARALPAAP